MSRKRTPRQREQAVQPELIFEEVPKPEDEQRASDLEAEQDSQDVTNRSESPTAWTRYGHQDSQNHDAKRREWLRCWSQEHGTKRYWFTMWGRYSGYYQISLLPGDEARAHFLEDACYYDIYCLFIAAFTPSVPLSHYLEDAAARGEIKGLVTNTSLRKI